MKLLLSIIAISFLCGWDILHHKNEFNEFTNKPKAINNFMLSQGKKSTYTNTRIIIFVYPTEVGISFPEIEGDVSDPAILAIRTPNGIVRMQGKGIISLVHLEGRNAKRFVRLLMKYRTIKISIKKQYGGYYAGDLDCRGFTKAWRKTGWR